MTSMARASRCVLMLAWAIAGCAQHGSSVFAPLDHPLVWPASPRPARIAYVGELSTSDELHGTKNPLQSAMETVLGNQEGRAVLTPFAVCTDDADRLFIADTGAQTVHVFDLRTRKYVQWKP